jgi:hypothetical protein
MKLGHGSPIPSGKSILIGACLALLALHSAMGCSMLRAGEMQIVHSGTRPAIQLDQSGKSENGAEQTDPNETKLRLRITWGGGVARTWQGRIWVDHGTVSNPTILSLDPKSPGSMFLEQNQLNIQSKSASSFGAVDIDVSGPPNANIFFEFTAIGDQWTERTSPVRSSVAFSELLNGAYGTPIDSQNNRIHFVRAPADRLRVKTQYSSMVFRPGQSFDFSVHPAYCQVEPNTKCKLRAQRFEANSTSPSWSNEIEIESGESGNFLQTPEFSVPVPLQGGPHRIQLDLYVPGNRYTFTRSREIASRKLDFVVVPMEDPRTVDDRTWELYQEIDPTQSSWWNTLQQHVPIHRLAGYSETVLSNAKSQIKDDELGRWLEINSGGWNAFPIPVKETGKPHLIEIEFRPDQRLLTGISIIQSDRVGEIPMYGIDSGISCQDPMYVAGNSSKPIVHRIHFWPSEQPAYLLIANHDEKASSLVGKIRISVGPERLPVATAKSTAIDKAGHLRQSWAYFESPLFPENFGANPAVDPLYNQSIDDWDMFYKGTDRFLQYLSNAGYRGAMVTVASESSSIYPSEFLEPTPKYDSGQFFSHGQDLIRKDVLKLMFEMFDQQGLTLIPTVELSGPIPELERFRRENPAEAAGIDLLHMHGHLLEADPNYAAHLSASYNPLHPRVRTAIYDIVDEIVLQYGHHKSFGGVAIKCGQSSYVTLPNQLWGYDLATVSEFMRETGVRAPANIDLQTASMSQRASWLLASHQQVWLQWRAAKITRLFHRLGDRIKAVNPNAKLVIAAVDMYQSDEARLSISPSLRWDPDFESFQLQMGIDQLAITKHDQILWLDGATLMPGYSLSETRVAEQASRSAPAQAFAAARRNNGDIRINRILWSEFDKLPIGNTRDGHSPIVHAQLLTQGAAEQRRFMAQRLAIRDSQVLVDGGQLLPIGQESQRNDWFATYQKLPATRFDDVITSEDNSINTSLVVRQAVVGDRRYFYAVNQSPWPVSAQLRFTNGNTHFLIESLGETSFLPRREANSAVVPVNIEPYGIVAGYTDPSVQLKNWTEEIPGEIRIALRAKADKLLKLIQLSQQSAPLSEIQNTDFDLQTASGQPAQWIVGRQGRERISTVNTGGYQSGSAMQMSSDGNATWIRSQPFSPPQTGRLSMSVWLRIEKNAPQPALRLAIEGRHFNKEYYRFAGVGSLAGGKAASPLTDQWQRYVVHFDDLPTEGLSQLQIGFDLMSRGEVWVDRVSVYDRWLDEDDARMLTQQRAVAQLLIDQGKFENARKKLDSYWFQFLETYIEETPQQASAEPEVHEANSARLIDRVRGIVPRRVFRFR